MEIKVEIQYPRRPSAIIQVPFSAVSGGPEDTMKFALDAKGSGMTSLDVFKYNIKYKMKLLGYCTEEAEILSVEISE